MARRESTIIDKSFSHDYAKRLLKRVADRLDRSAKNRARRQYAAGYREAAGRVRKLVQ